MTLLDIVVGLRVAVTHDHVTYFAKVVDLKPLAPPKNPVYLVEYLDCRGDKVRVWKHAPELSDVAEVLPGGK